MSYSDPYRSTVKYTKRLFIGLDLGQSKDYTALAIVERVPNEKEKEIAALNCVHLQRWKLRTSYPAIVADVVRMMGNLEGYPSLAIDATGVGAPVVDLFKQEKIRADLRPIQIVAGATVSEEDGVTRVPKRDLVSTVQVGLQNRILKIAEAMPNSAVLTRELENFTVKITDAANDIYGVWREGKHDDLVLAVALALWTANQPEIQYPIEPSVSYFVW